MRLDHLSYAARPEHLAETVQRIGGCLAGVFVDGGVHPRFGTRNFVLAMCAGTYIEVVAALDHPAAEAAPFGRAVKARAAAGGGWMGWAVRVTDISGAEARLGRPAVAGHRIRPDGRELRWRQLGILDTMVNPALPYFIRWETEAADHPSFGGHDVSIDRIELVGSERAVCEWLGEPATHPLDETAVDWFTPGEATGLDPGILSVEFRTRKGLVSID